MGKPRDSQRQRIYDAEGMAFGNAGEEMTLDEVRALAEKVLASSVVRRHYPRALQAVVVADGRSRRRGAYSPWQHQISLPRRTRCQWYVLHEVAHHLSFEAGEPWHGWQFARTYLFLVRKYMGAAAEAQLKWAFKETRVKWRKPRKA